jgi:hypothetical protein
MKNISVFILLLCLQMTFAQVKSKLPFTGMKSFSFCEGNACESEITINKDGYCTIVSYGFMREEKHTEYKGKYQEILWVYKNGKKSYGYKIVGGNVIFQVETNGKVSKDCFDSQACKSKLYYWDKNGNLQN